MQHQADVLGDCQPDDDHDLLYHVDHHHQRAVDLHSLLLENLFAEFVY